MSWGYWWHDGLLETALTRDKGTHLCFIINISLCPSILCSSTLAPRSCEGPTTTTSRPTEDSIEIKTLKILCVLCLLTETCRSCYSIITTFILLHTVHLDGIINQTELQPFVLWIGFLDVWHTKVDIPWKLSFFFPPMSEIIYFGFKSLPTQINK